MAVASTAKAYVASYFINVWRSVYGNGNDLKSLNVKIRQKAKKFDKRGFLRYNIN